MEQNPYAAPTADVAQQRVTAAPQSLLQTFFSFHGRMRRGRYWACTLGAWAAFFVVCAACGAVMGVSGRTMASDSDPLITAVIVVLYPPLLWSSFALQAKRWHDRDKSAWWALLGAIPLANIWVMIELGFLAGTPGPNDYGPPPP